jgi:hypothetical protein
MRSPSAIGPEFVQQVTFFDRAEACPGATETAALMRWRAASQTAALAVPAGLAETRLTTRHRLGLIEPFFSALDAQGFLHARPSESVARVVWLTGSPNADAVLAAARDGWSVELFALDSRTQSRQTLTAAVRDLGGRRVALAVPRVTTQVAQNATASIEVAGIRAAEACRSLHDHGVAYCDIAYLTAGGPADVALMHVLDAAARHGVPARCEHTVEGAQVPAWLLLCDLAVSSLHPASVALLYHKFRCDFRLDAEGLSEVCQPLRTADAPSAQLRALSDVMSRLLDLQRASEPTAGLGALLQSELAARAKQASPRTSVAGVLHALGSPRTLVTGDHAGVSVVPPSAAGTCAFRATVISPSAASGVAARAIAVTSEQVVRFDGLTSRAAA